MGARVKRRASGIYSASFGLYATQSDDAMHLDGCDYEETLQASVLFLQTLCNASPYQHAPPYSFFQQLSLLCQLSLRSTYRFRKPSSLGQLDLGLTQPRDDLFRLERRSSRHRNALLRLAPTA